MTFVTNIHIRRRSLNSKYVIFSSRISNSDKNAQSGQVEETASGDDSNKSMPSTPNNSSSSLSILASPRCSHTPEGQTCEGVVNLQGALASMQVGTHFS